MGFLLLQNEVGNSSVQLAADATSEIQHVRASSPWSAREAGAAQICAATSKFRNSGAGI